MEVSEMAILITAANLTLILSMGIVIGWFARKA
jgi:hypothetical protein